MIKNNEKLYNTEATWLRNKNVKPKISVGLL